MKLKQRGWRLCAIFAPDVIGMTTTTITSTLSLFEPLAESIYVISGNLPDDIPHSKKVRIVNIRMKGIENTQSPMLVKIPRFIIIQLKMSYGLFKIANEFDALILAGGTSTLPIPTLVAKLLGKKIVSLRSGTGAVQELAKITYEKSVFGMGKYIFVPIVGIMERLNYSLSDKIIVFRSTFTHQALNRYKNKLILGCSRFYVDTNQFKVILRKNPNSREYSIGFIGRFVDLGGSLNFAKALPLVLKEFPEIKVLIGGDGPLRDDIEKEIKDLDGKVTLAGWIPHDDMPQYLNMTKLLTIPSYQEEGPHILFEAMACGTIVLATPVGVIPDVIEDGITGFIMKDNSPECIARNVIRVLNYPNLDKIASNARELIEKEYTYDRAVEKYRLALASLK